jgi:hypothetical protein
MRLIGKVAMSSTERSRRWRRARKAVAIKPGARCFRCGSRLRCQRSTRRYCSHACRESAYRRRRLKKVWRRHVVPRVAKQFAIRQTLVGRQTQRDLRNSEVRPISRSTAAAVIKLFEPMARVVTHSYGLFFGDALVAVCAFGPLYSGNLHQRPGCIGLLRGACLPEAPRNSGSRLIRGAMKMLPPQYSSVEAFSDSTHGEKGAIYKAAGFTDLGPSVGGHRVVVHHEGKTFHDRSARRRFGTASAPKLAAMGMRVELIPRRRRYVAVR